MLENDIIEMEYCTMAKNEGKRFESAFIKSVPDHVLVKRLNDNAAGWSNGTNTRFSSNNECDYIRKQKGRTNIWVEQNLM